MFIYKDANHQTVGPVSTEEIHRLIRAGQLNRHSLLSAEGSDYWQSAHRFPELAPAFETATTPAESDSTAEPVIDIESDKTEDPSPPAPPSLPGSTPSAPGGATAEQETPESTPPPNTDSKKTEPSSDKTDPEPGRDPKPPGADSGFSGASDTRYFFVGGDDREYGPVTADQLRRWIKERRANAASKVRPESSTEWRPLGSVPEFESLFTAQQQKQRTETPPSLDGIRADQIAEDIISDRYDLSITACFSRSRDLYLNHFAILTGTTALVLVILSTLHSLAGVGTVIAIALGGVFAAGMSRVFLRTIRGQRATVQDLFDGFSNGFVPLLVSGILTSVLITAGWMVCVLPGIYLMVAWLFVFPLIQELRLDFWPAMELSRKVVHERWWELFGLLLGAALLVVLGLMLFVVGVFFTTPIAFGAVMYAFQDIFGNHLNRSLTDVDATVEPVSEKEG